VNLNFIAEYPPIDIRPPDMNPHGLSLRQDLDLLISSDFVDPLSTLTIGGGTIILRDTVRIWNPWSARQMTSTIHIPGGRGLMEVKFVPGDPDAIAYVTNYDDQEHMIMWGIKALELSIFQAINLSNYFDFTANDFMLHQPNSKGTRYILSNPDSGWFVLLDISDPLNPVVLDGINFGLKSGLHSLDLSSDEKYIMVSGYFIDEDNLGYLHFDGDRMVHIVQIEDTQLIQTDFNVDMNVAGDYPMRPHMCRFYNKPLTQTV